MKQPVITLYNGVKMPALVFGTDNMRDEDGAEEIVYQAIKAGYRHIDTAEIYHNEESIGRAIKRAIKEGIVKREDLFITTKAPFSRPGYDETLNGYDEALKRLDLEYIDLYLLHHNYTQFHDPRVLAVNSWRAMEKLYMDKRVRAIGVSNYDDCQYGYAIGQIVWEAFVKPMVNEIQCHPQYQQKGVVAFCKQKNIAVLCWGALNQGKIFNVPLYQELANKYHKTITQIAIQWSLQKGYAPIAKSKHVERIQENLQVGDFVLSDDDMKKLDSLNGGDHSLMHTVNNCLVTNMTIPQFAGFIQDFKYEQEAIIKFLGMPVLKKKIFGNPFKNCIVKYYLFGIQLIVVNKKGKTQWKF